MLALLPTTIARPGGGIVLRLFLALGCAIAATAHGSMELTNEERRVIIVVGAPGEPEFGKDFKKWAEQWQAAAEHAGAKVETIGLSTNNAAEDRVALQTSLATQTNGSLGELWLVLIGHGTFNGREAKFNLRGADLTAADLSAWLQGVRRPTAIINCASASAPFLNELSAPHRIVVTSTRSGSEQNYARIGGYLAQAITAPAADLDKDGQTSLLEAFLSAARQVAEFYELEGRLATEHALLDDNGDRLGTPPDWFRGVRAIKKAKDGATADGLRAHQFHLLRSKAEAELSPETRRRRNEIELALVALRERKTEMPEAEYYQELERLLLDMARLYQGNDTK